MTRPLSAGGTRSGGPGGLCAQLGSPALPARSPGAGRAQPRRGATSPPGPPRAPSLCAHGRTNLTALRHAAERTFNVVGFFSSRFCLVGVPADFCLFFLSFFFSAFLLLLPFLLFFPVRFGTWHRPAAAPAGRGGGTATLAPRAASPAGKMRLLRRWGPSRGGRERKPAATEL